MTTILITLLAAIPLAQQGSPPDQKTVPSQSVVAPAAAEALVGPRWTLTAIADSPPEALTGPDGPRGARYPHLEFFPTGSVTGADGCNTFRGGYTASRDSIAFKELMGTLMVCSGPDKLDQRFRDALGRARAWKVEQQTLSLLDEKGAVVARFEPRS